MYGGVGGAEPQGSPLSRSIITPCLLLNNQAQMCGDGGSSCGGGKSVRSGLQAKRVPTQAAFCIAPSLHLNLLTSMLG